MAEMKKINVELYGGPSLFSKKETPLVADEIYCSGFEHCQFYENNTCICCRAAFSIQYCPYGRAKSTKGYTSRAKKYSAFRNKYREDEVFGVLKRPNDVFLRLSNDYVYVDLPYTSLSYVKEPDDSKRGYKCSWIGPKKNISFGDPNPIGSGEDWIPKDDIDVETIVQIASFKPRTFLESQVIAKYQDKVVPAFIDDIKNFWPEMYARIQEEAPELCKLEVDYCGRKAYLTTLRTGITLNSRNGQFVFDGEHLICDNFNAVLVSVAGVEAKKSYLSIPIDADTVVEVQDNSWVIPGKTKFK